MAVNKKYELIVKTRSVVKSSVSGHETASILSSSVLNDFLNLGITLRPIAKSLKSADASPEFTANAIDDSEIMKFFKVDAPEERLPELLERLNKAEEIEAAYIKPPAEPAVMQLNKMLPAPFSSPPAMTPNFRNRQLYLDAAPTGVDAQQAWNVPGGKGTGVNIIDIEWGWRFTHEDLRLNQGGVVSGNNSSDDNHGTAVLGVFGGDENSFGIVGISPDANVSAVSLEDNLHTTSEAIIIAANKLQRGDIILIEVHRPGPMSHLGNNQFGFIGIEWWPDDFAAIRYATEKGIIVVEAAGNGGQDLDNAIYDKRPVNDPFLGTFPPNWTNPFDMSNTQSGAVIVGAGLPPSGTHKRKSQPDCGDVYQDRGRCFFSNYGERVDAQGWGWEVTTTGYGDLQGGINKDVWYTDEFSGTSSASPVIVGVLACLQGILKSRGSLPLTSQQAIQLLRNSGSPQQDAPGFTFKSPMSGSGYPQVHPPKPRTQRIGNRPDLQQLITMI
jgi:hypothetical protein